MTNKLLLTGLTALTILSCAKDPIELNVVGNDLPIALVQTAQQKIEVEQLKAEIAALEAQAEVDRQMIANLEANIVELNLMIEDQSVIISNQVQMIENLKSNIIELEAKIVEKDIIIEELIDINKDLAFENNKLNDLVQELNNAVSSQATTIDNLQAEVDAQNNVINELNNQVNELVNTLNTYVVEIQELTDTVENQQDVIDTLTDRLTIVFEFENALLLLKSQMALFRLENNGGSTFDPSNPNIFIHNGQRYVQPGSQDNFISYERSQELFDAHNELELALNKFKLGLLVNIDRGLATLESFDRQWNARGYIRYEGPTLVEALVSLTNLFNEDVITSQVFEQQFTEDFVGIDVNEDMDFVDEIIRIKTETKTYRNNVLVDFQSVYTYRLENDLEDLTGNDTDFNTAVAEDGVDITYLGDVFTQTHFLNNGAFARYASVNGDAITVRNGVWTLFSNGIQIVLN